MSRWGVKLDKPVVTVLNDDDAQELNQVFNHNHRGSSKNDNLISDSKGNRTGIEVADCDKNRDLRDILEGK